MKKTSTLALAAASAAFASPALQANELAVTVDVTYVSDYVFRGVEVDGAALQPSIEASFGDFYAGVWHSTALEGRRMGTETDLYTGYGIALDETFSLDLGVTRYLYEANSAADSTEVFLGASADVFLTPSIYYYYDFDNELHSLIGSVGYSIPLEAVNSSLDFTGTLGHIMPKGANNDFTYGSIGVALPYSLAENATLTVGADYILNDTRALGATNSRKTKLVGTVGLSIGF